MVSPPAPHPPLPAGEAKSPVKVALARPKLTLPRLVSLTLCAGLGCPSEVRPKLSDPGETVTGGVPVPVKLTAAVPRSCCGETL